MSELVEPSDLLDGKVELDPTVDFIAGTASGITGLLVGHPFDTVKVRFQTPETASKYRSMAHAVSTIIREERSTGLYKGIASPLATAALLNGVVFASYRFFIKIQSKSSETIPTLGQIALAGAGAGIVSTSVTTPTELIKIRQQASLTQTSAHRIALQIFKEGGVRGLYRGLGATMIRDVGYGTYFFTYEAICRYLTPSRAEGSSQTATPASWAALLVAGGLAGVCSWFSTFPLDVVKTRVQGSAMIPSPTILRKSSKYNIFVSRSAQYDANPYRTALSTIVNSYRAEGMGVFFRGLAPTLVRAIPVNMVTFATFEAVVHGLS